MKKEEFRELIKKISNGEATDQEIALYNRFYNEYQKAGELWDRNEMGEQQEVYAKLTQKIQDYIKPVPVVPIWKKFRGIAVAAVILILLSTGIYLIRTNYLKYGSNIDSIANTSKDIAPGSNKAILKLANGKTINLSDAGNGELAEQAGIAITKTKDGQLVYGLRRFGADEISKANKIPNTISTPKGGQYQIILPDGTHVWLNASSSLKFPVSFANVEQRKVELTGEAYFEVAKDKSKPFRVVSGSQIVEVLGTHFNINSYADEPTTKTTLLEGSVRVLRQAQHDNIILKPGEQSINSGSTIRVHEADIESAIAWKNGKFKFDNENIRDLMRKVARWYDVEVVYEGVMTNKDFSGSVSRFDHISKILDVLQSTNTVHFKVEGRRVTVMP